MTGQNAHYDEDPGAAADNGALNHVDPSTGEISGDVDDIRGEDLPGDEVSGGDVLDLVESLLGEIKALSQRLDGVQEQAEWAVDELTKHPAGGPWYWVGLDEKDTAALWEELAGFVQWLHNRILRHVPRKDYGIAPCWWRHPDAVEYLTALMVSHQAAYKTTSARATTALSDWVLRSLWPTIELIKENCSMKNCLRDGHAERELEAEMSGHEPGLLELMTPPGQEANPVLDVELVAGR